MINKKEFAIDTEVFYISPVPNYELYALCKYHIMKGKIQAFVDLDTVTVGNGMYYSSVVKDKDKSSELLKCIVEEVINDSYRTVEQQIKDILYDVVKDKAGVIINKLLKGMGKVV